MIALHYPPPGDAKPLARLIMLPGAGMAAADFAAQGMVDELHARNLPIHIIAAGPDISLYLDDKLADALHHAVIAPAGAAGPSRLWLLGISLGGMGALQYASSYRSNVETIFLLAPFLGTQGTIAQITQAGGLQAWSPTPTTPLIEGRLLTGLQNILANPEKNPSLQLGYGDADRFADGHRHLAAQLPATRIAKNPGAHDWPTWRALWRDLLDKTLPALHLDGAPDRRI